MLIMAIALLVLAVACLILALTVRKFSNRLDKFEDHQAEVDRLNRLIDKSDAALNTYSTVAEAKIAQLETELSNAHMSLLLVLDEDEKELHRA